MDSHTSYRILGLSEGATIAEVKAAYRKLALRYHPDKGVSKQDGEKFMAITEAYGILRSGVRGARPSVGWTVNHPAYEVKMSKGIDLGTGKIFDMIGRYSGHARIAYCGVFRYEQELVRHFTKVAKHAYYKAPRSFVGRHARNFKTQTFKICNPVLGKNLRLARSKIMQCL